MCTGQQMILEPTECMVTHTLRAARQINGSSTIPDNNNCTSSVLFDGNNSSLSVDGSMWASQLLILQAASFAQIHFVFSESTTYGVGRVEVLLFNCPQWGMGVQSIALATSGSARPKTIDSNLTSCESLLRVCMQYFTCNDASFNTSFNMTFGLSPGSMWVHLAEVTFYSGWDATACPPDAVLNPQPSATTPPISTNTPSLSGTYVQ